MSTTEARPVGHMGCFLILTTKNFILLGRVHFLSSGVWKIWSNLFMVLQMNGGNLGGVGMNLLDDIPDSGTLIEVLRCMCHVNHLLG